MRQFKRKNRGRPLIIGISVLMLGLFVVVASFVSTTYVTDAQVKPGIEVLLDEYMHLIEQKNVGLITNMTGVDSEKTHIADVLQQHSSDVNVAAFFAPEHGLRGDKAAGEYVASYVDEATGVPVYSLYGETRKPTPSMLEDVDVLLFDIQDVGTRFYTYIYTMAYAMEAAAEEGIPFVVLDRPNPIGGTIVEGPILDTQFSSFIGMYPIALRHGMTVGELARYFNSEYGIDTELTVVPMRGWQRDMWFNETGLPWIAPSPNMVTVDTAFVYPGMGLIEGTNVSEGRGTEAPFEIIGAPWVDGEKLAAVLNEQHIPGVQFQPVTFTPTESKFAGVPSEGVRVEVTDRDVFRSVTTGFHVIGALYELYDEFAWRPPSGGQHFFDLLTGHKHVRWLVEQNTPADNIVSVWEGDVSEFKAKRAQYLIY